jgi:hypothetical protein
LDVLPADFRARYERGADQGNDLTVMPSFDVWRQAFMQDADEDAQRIIYGLLRPQPCGTLEEPARDDAFFGLEAPMCYILPDDDHAMPPSVWAQFAARLREPLMLSVPGGHEAGFTRPDELSQALLAACRQPLSN